jgi:hypothetical protein
LFFEFATNWLKNMVRILLSHLSDPI